MNYHHPSQYQEPAVALMYTHFERKLTYAYALLTISLILSLVIMMFMLLSEVKEGEYLRHGAAGQRELNLTSPLRVSVENPPDSSQEESEE